MESLSKSPPITGFQLTPEAFNARIERKRSDGWTSGPAGITKRRLAHCQPYRKPDGVRFFGLPSPVPAHVQPAGAAQSGRQEFSPVPAARCLRAHRGHLGAPGIFSRRLAPRRVSDAFRAKRHAMQDRDLPQDPEIGCRAEASKLCTAEKIVT